MMTSPASPGTSVAGGKLLSLSWPMLLIMSVMLLLSIASVSTVSALRAYVNGESQYSKAERQAIAELRRYALSRDERDWHAYLEQLAVPLGDRDARLALERPQPDAARARRGLLAGRNDPRDIPGMITLHRWFKDLPLIASANECWRQADALILELAAVGESLHVAVQAFDDGPTGIERAADPGSPRRRQDARIATLLEQAEQVHRRLAPIEDRYSELLGEASRRLTRVLVALLSVCAVALVAMGTAISRRSLRRSERLEQALRASEAQVHFEQERAAVTLSSIASAVVSIDRERRITYMNAAAEWLTGWNAREARGREVREVLRIRDAGEGCSVLEHLDRVQSGEAGAGTPNGVLLERRDGTLIPVHERAAPIRDLAGGSSGIVLMLRDITQERALASRLEHQATHDALTGLVNRSEFEARLTAALEQQRRSGENSTLLYLDLDQFKVINDTCGHAAGDELIRQVAWLVRAELREAALLARLGGDEFGVLLPGCELERAAAIAETIRRRIEELRFRWDDKLFVVNVSIGVVSLDEVLPTVSAALSAADQACYHAKDNGRNRITVYRPDDQQIESRHGEMRWVERLHAALDEDSFVLVAQEIQPLARAQARNDLAQRLEGAAARTPTRRFELLLRMVDAQGQPIAPMAFIPAAERYGLMPRIDRWVIAHACRELAALRSRGLELPICMINLSGASVSEVSLADHIKECLAENGLAGRNVGFEVTETAAIGNLASASLLMSRLRDLGCPIALDDFGSGMSSFSYLKALPIDLLKIDGVYVRNLKTDLIDRALIESIQRIARLMGIKTVAECVEDEAALEGLLLLGVDYGQGYYLHRPVLLSSLTQEPALLTPLRTPQTSGALG